MNHSSSWFEDKPLRAAGSSPPSPETGSPSPPAPPANTAASGGGVRAAAAVRPLISFRCQLAQRLRDAVGSRSNRFVATVTGYNEETVRRYLRDGGPSAEFLASVCREFGVCAEWLLLGAGPMRHPPREALPGQTPIGGDEAPGEVAELPDDQARNATA